jgi:hypothetical protein
MRRIRIVGLCLVAVFALGAFMASSALALPEYGKCVAKAGTGKYTESNCVKKAKTLTSEKQFERVKAKEIVKENFKGASGTSFLEGESGIKIVCSSGTNGGNLDKDGTTLAAKGVENVIAKFNGCGIPAFGLQCKSAGAGSEEIVTNTLEGSFVYKNKAAKEILQELHPKVKKGAFASFECGGGAVDVLVKERTLAEGGKEGHDCIFGVVPVANVNVMSATGQLNFSGSGGKQSPQTDEKLKPAKCNLESQATVGGTPEPVEFSSQNQEVTITYEEAIEVFA